MTVYDVVVIVKPGAPTSIESGRWLVEHHASEEMARTYAERGNTCTLIPEWVSFHVETHDELSESRAYPYRDRHRYATTTTDPRP